MRLSASQLETIRRRPQQTKLYMSIFEPQIVFQARINDGSIARGERTITYDTVSLGNFNAIKPGATMWIGTTAGAMDVGKIRVRSATSSEIIVSENSNVEWADNLFLTVFYYFELWPVFPRVIQDPSNDEEVIFFKDYDIAYTNQNSILGTFINMGPHRAKKLDPASGQTQLYYTSSGTHNLLGSSMTYDWWFQGATVTGSSSANPGFITYNTPGNYITRLTISGSNGSIDTSYRTVRIHDDSDPPIQKWQLNSLNGSRDEGGYTASFKVFEDIPIQEHAVVVIFGENWYGSTKQSLGGNYPNGSEIFWVGYVDRDSIQYDYQHSEVTFDAHSITGMMRESSGYAISVESRANPSTWFEIDNIDGRKAIYHYLKWHTTALNIADFQFVGDDYLMQFFDTDRESMYDAIDNLMRNALWGKVTSDRQGKVWMEVNAEAYTVPTDSFPSVMNITRRDWMNEPSVEERLSEDTSFIEMGGVAYSGTTTGTFSALLAAAPGNTPGFQGTLEVIEGLIILGQEQLNQLTGNVYANRNSQFPTIGMEMANNLSNLDIAPQETVGINILPSDTIRNLAISGLYIPSGFDWEYSAQDSILLPRIDYRELVNGIIGETITIPPPEDTGGDGFAVPGLQIPPIPPLVFPSYSIPTGTISQIVSSQINSFLNQYVDVGWHDDVFSTQKSAGITVISASRSTSPPNLPTIRVDDFPTGLYVIMGYIGINMGSAGDPGDEIQVNLSMSLGGGATIIAEADQLGVVTSSEGVVVSCSCATIRSLSPSSLITLSAGGGIGNLNIQNFNLVAFRISA